MASVAPLRFGLGCASAFLVEDQITLASTRQQRCEFICRSHDGHQANQGANQQSRIAPWAFRRSAQNSKHSDNCRSDRQQSQCPDQSELRNKNETGDHGTSNTAERIEGRYCPDTRSDRTFPNDQTQGGGKSSAKKDRGQQDKTGRCNKKARTHSGQLVAAQSQHRELGASLQLDEPIAQKIDLKERCEAGKRYQQAENTPWVADPIRPAAVQGSPNSQTCQVGRKHDGEGEGPRAHELNNRL